MLLPPGTYVRQQTTTVSGVSVPTRTPFEMTGNQHVLASVNASRLTARDQDPMNVTMNAGTIVGDVRLGTVDDQNYFPPRRDRRRRRAGAGRRRHGADSLVDHRRDG